MKCCPVNRGVVVGGLWGRGCGKSCGGIVGRVLGGVVGGCRVEMSLSGVDTRDIASPMHVETEELSQCTAWQ